MVRDATRRWMHRAQELQGNYFQSGHARPSDREVRKDNHPLNNKTIMDDADGPAARGRHGQIDFSQYSIEQLRELEPYINLAEFPETRMRLLAALAQKESRAGVAPGLGTAVAGRFSARSGFLGWVQAKLARSPLYGAGFVSVVDDSVLLGGWQRSWLGVPLETQIRRDTKRVRNVVQYGASVRFEMARKYFPAECVDFQADSADQAELLSRWLPGVTTTGFLERWSTVRDFHDRLQAVSRPARVTPVVVALNVSVFAIMAAMTRKLGRFAPQELLDWGANYGALTVNGQWWRLLTAMFEHWSVLHLVLNMWALWNAGNLTERLFGRGTYLLIYLTCGILAGLGSVAWDPSHYSVGASGAIFGVFGAFLAFFLKERRQIPPSTLRRHWLSTAAFVVFNLVTGAMQPAVDNAAHVGGLLSGIALGFILARPLDREARRSFPLAACMGVLGFTAAAILGALWQVKGIGSGLTIPEQFARRHTGYMSGQSQNLQLWNELGQRATAGTMSAAELHERFEREIAPFWETQSTKLKEEGARGSG